MFSNKRFKDRLFSDEVKTRTRGQLLDLLAKQAADPAEGPSGARASEDDTGVPAAKVPRPSFLSSMLEELMEETQQDPDDNMLAVTSQLNLYLSEPPIPSKKKEKAE